MAVNSIAYSAIEPSATATGRNSEKPGTRAPMIPTFAYGSIASSTTWSVTNANVNTETISCHGNVCFVLRHSPVLRGWLSTSPRPTSRASSRYAVIPSARAAIHGRSSAVRGSTAGSTWSVTPSATSAAIAPIETRTDPLTRMRAPPRGAATTRATGRERGCAVRRSALGLPG